MGPVSERGRRSCSEAPKTSRYVIRFSVSFYINFANIPKQFFQSYEAEKLFSLPVKKCFENFIFNFVFTNMIFQIFRYIFKDNFNSILSYCFLPIFPHQICCQSSNENLERYFQTGADFGGRADTPPPLGIRHHADPKGSPFVLF